MITELGRDEVIGLARQTMGLPEGEVDDILTASLVRRSAGYPLSLLADDLAKGGIGMLEAHC